MKTSVQMAVIGAAHGIRGEVRVKTFTDDPLALGDYGPLHSQDGRLFKVQDIRPAGTVVVVRFSGVSDRDAAEALNGTELFVDRAALPKAEDGEFYHEDLVGLHVLDEAGATRGKVTAVQNFGGGDILEIVFDGSKGVLIPFTEAAVPVVDLPGRLIRIDCAAAGLVDDPDEEQAGDRPRGPKESGGNR